MTLARKTGRSLFTHRSLPKMFSKTCPSGPLFFKYLPGPASTAFVCLDRASVILAGQRLQMLIHRARQILIGHFFGFGTFSFGELHNELRRLAVDDEQIVAGQKYKRIGSKPLTSLGILGRVLQQEIPPLLQAKGFQRVRKEDLGELTGAAGI